MCTRLLCASRPCLWSFVSDVYFGANSLTNMSRQEFGQGTDVPYRRGGRGRSPRRGSGGRGGRGGFGGPPPGLRGREIGMYYRNKSLAHRKEREKNERAVVCIDRAAEANISRLLEEVRAVQPESHPHGAAVGMDTTDSVTSPFPVLVRGTDVAASLSDEQLQQELKDKQSQLGYTRMQEFRHKLPSWSMQEAILESIALNQVVVVHGETGCGKTTQIPQFILDSAIQCGSGSKCQVICTQPRRISAISVAHRVASERNEALGQSVGYQIRLEQTLPRHTGSILYCTTGIMLRRLITDPTLSQCTHLLLDEVHERSLQSDFLSTVVRDVLPRRPDLKVILMSATINANLFSRYFGGAPLVSIPGSVFPVQEYYLEDVLQITSYQPRGGGSAGPRPFWSRYGQGKHYWTEKEEKRMELEHYVDELERLQQYPRSVTNTLKQMDLSQIDLQLMLLLLRHICHSMEEGAILVFLPGWDTISKFHDMLKADPAFRGSSRYLILPLHSLMPSTTQRQVFDRPPPGVRKIIIATNIAETSITIDDVVFVVDCGMVKETNYDALNLLATLEAVPVSKAAAKQRRGRAGRVQPGHCFHLFTRHQLERMADFQEPEMLRTPLEELVLQIKVLKLGMVAPLLARAVEPPPDLAVINALNTLKDLSALTGDEELTPLGYHLANLPVHPRVGRMILFAAMFSCLDPILTIASTLGFKEPFVIPLHKMEEADAVRKRFAGNTQSDHITFLRAFTGWEQAKQNGNAREYCWDHFLAANTLEMLANMKKQFAGLLRDTGFIHSADPHHHLANANSDNLNLVKAILCAGLYPNVAKIAPPTKGNAKISTQYEKRVQFHPKSVNNSVPATEFTSRFLIYHTKVKSSNIFLHDTTVIHPFPLLFFGGDISVQQEDGQETIAVDKWIVFQAPQRIAELVKDMRKQLDVVLEQKIAQPQMDLYVPGSSSPSSQLIQAIIDLITTEDYSKQHQRLMAGKHLYHRR